MVKLTFAKGASLKDPKKLFNSSLEGNARRAIDIREQDKLDEKAFKELILSAVALTAATRAAKAPRARQTAKATKSTAKKPASKSTKKPGAKKKR